MSVFHRVDDMYLLPARRFFRLAGLLPAYDGAVRRALLADQETEQQGQAATLDELRSNPSLAGVIEIGG